MYLENNPYGFKVRVSHKKINPLYIKYKEYKEVSLHYPLDDSHRLEFEQVLISHWKTEQEEKLRQKRSKTIALTGEQVDISSDKEKTHH